MQATEVFKRDGFVWLDIVNPTKAELDTLAKTFGLHPELLRDSLDPVHLPKHEQIGEIGFVILRAYDEESSKDADTVRELTRKVAAFYAPHFLITIHRKDQPYLVALKDAWVAKTTPVDGPGPIVADLIRAVLTTYDAPIEEALDELEALEMSVFDVPGAASFDLRQGYYLKRRAAVFRRMLRSTQDVLPKVAAGCNIAGTRVQDLRETVEHLLLYADELVESINTLLDLHISLSSQKINEAAFRTGEIVRVLTIFSVFVLPLNVITGIYGMNFEHMPELKSPFGYPLVLATMVVVILTIYGWFRQRGWLRGSSAAKQRQD